MTGSHRNEDAVSVEFRCRDVGVACKNVARAGTPDELVKAVAAHAKAKHGVELNGTLIDYAVTKVRPAGG
jgi:predicted small metal-binding protein